MSEPTDEPQDWPLRDYSARLRPPGRIDEPAHGEPQSEPEILYDEDDLAELPEADAADYTEVVPEEAPEPVALPAEAAVVVPEQEEVEEVEEAEVPAEHAEAQFRVPDGYQVLEGV